jgi:hypothetical protein
MAISKQNIWKLVSNNLKFIFILDQNTSNMNVVIYFHYYKVEFNYNAYIRR